MHRLAAAAAAPLLACGLAVAAFVAPRATSSPPCWSNSPKKPCPSPSTTDSTSSVTTTSPSNSNSTTTTTTATTTTSTTTATSATATPQSYSYQFVGNFDTGSLSQWDWGAQCANTGTPSDSSYTRGSMYVNQTNVLQGSYAAQINMPSSSLPRACEVLHKRVLSLGTDQYFAEAIYFPSNWTEPSSAFWGAVMGQFNYTAIWSPPVGIFVHGSYANLVLQSGHCNDSTSSSPGCPYTTESGGAVGTISANDRIIPTGTALASRWVEMIVHVHWAADSSGVLEGWWRYPGGIWQRTVSISGYPTVQWSDAKPLASFCTSLGQSNCNVTSDKIGFYSYASPTAFTIRIDAFAEGSSFGDATAALP